MRLHLVDGTFELFRAQYSKRPDHHTPDGRPFKAVAGLLSSMIALLTDPAEAVTHLAIAFDNPIRSFRNDLYAGYKTDEGMDPELRSQFDAAEAAMVALGVAVWSMDRWEADDALATAATRWRDEVEQVRILTPDKDLGQVLHGTRVVQVDRIRQTETDEAAFRARRGIAPASLPDFLGLVGDSADGFPGLKGWGETSTAKVLGRWGHIEAIPAVASDWDVDVRGAERLASSLRENLADALLYRTLATVVTDVPLPQDLDGLRWRGPTAGFVEGCRRTGLSGMVGRVPRVRG